MRATCLMLATTACGGPPDADVTAIDDTDLPADATVWRLDASDDPQMAFAATGLLGIPASGVWTRYAVTVIEGDEADPATWTIRVTIDMDSVETGIDRLDTHLRTPDFLDVQAHPEATFVSTALVSAGAPDRWRVEGDLTVRGATRPVSWETDLRPQDGRLRTTAALTLSRWDFGLHAPDMAAPGDDGASDAVDVSYGVTLVRQP